MNSVAETAAPIWRILIIFDGDQKQLDPGWTSGLIGRIEPKLIDAGIEEFPSPSFIEKSEWLRSESQATPSSPGGERCDRS